MNTRRRFPSSVTWVVAVLGPVGAISLLPTAGAVGGDLPVALLDLGASFTRMALAYLLSLGFALAYGYYAATRPVAERVMIPTLDILQSVPILGFFPIAIVFFVSLTGPGSLLGPNLASIFLIFTSMSWNMTFGVYESLKSVPTELREAADAFGLQGRERLRRLLAPATVNRLVYNTVLSWTAGWYYLVAAEFISVSNSNTVLPGIGSFLLTAAGNQDAAALAAGLGSLIALIVVLDVFLWRPLARWAERFRYDTAPSGEGMVAEIGSRTGPGTFRRAAGSVVRGMRRGIVRVGQPFATLGSRVARSRPLEGAATRFASAPRILGLGAILTLVWLLLIALGVAITGVLTRPVIAPVADQIRMLPLATAFSFGRVVAAYVVSLLIAFPLALLIYRSQRASHYGLPAVEIVASVPATALFPLFIFALLPYFGFQGAAILMIITGMIWYLFFNILSGLRSIPPDLDEAARSFGLPRSRYYRRLVLPAVFPAFVTGSITAFGGGWNTLVIAEYIHYSASQQFQVLGVGELLNVGIQFPNNQGLPLVILALFALIAVVVAVNEALWKPLYRRATERNRID